MNNEKPQGDVPVSSSVERSDSPARRDPTCYVSLLTYNSDINIAVTRIKRPDREPFLTVDIDHVTWQPDREQLIELRDKITAFLAEEEGR